MERLTIRNPNGKVLLSKSATIYDVFDKLAMLEDAEEIKQHGCDKCKSGTNTYYDGNGYLVKMDFCPKCGKNLTDLSSWINKMREAVK